MEEKQKPRNKQRNRGFTIVELLIVIVIIGILAALIIAIYSGIQQRAKNTSRIASAKELQKLINAYVVQEGKYPYNGEACVGAGYIDYDSNGTLDCFVIAANERHPSSALDTELRKVAAIPKVETSTLKAGSYNAPGYVYFSNNIIDGKPGRVYLNYYLEGLNLNCGVPGVLTIIDYATSEHATNGAINTLGNHIGATLCQIPIVEP